MHSWSKTYKLIGSLPLLLTATLITVYFYTAFLTGHPPGYEDPDPKTIPGHDMFYNMLTAGILLWIVSALAWAIMTLAYCVCYIRRRDKLPTGAFFFSLLSLLFAYGCFLFIGGWFLD